MILSLLLLFASIASAGEVPAYIRSLDEAKDVDGVNENFRSLSRDIKRDRERLLALEQNVTTSTGAVTFSGNVVFNASATFNGTIFAFPVPAAYAVSITSEAANDLGPYSVGVTSVTETGTGSFTVTLSTPFINNGYTVMLSPEVANGFCFIDSERDVRHFKVTCTNSGGSGVTPNKLGMLIYGVLNP